MKFTSLHRSFRVVREAPVRGAAAYLPFPFPGKIYRSEDALSEEGATTSYASKMRLKEKIVLDLFDVILFAAMFALCWFYVHGCEHLKGVR